MQEQDAASPHGFLPTFQHFATQAIHVGQEPEQWTSRAVVPPISLSTTFKYEAPGRHSVHINIYGRPYLTDRLHRPPTLSQDTKLEGPWAPAWQV